MVKSGAVRTVASFAGELEGAEKYAERIVGV